MFDFFLNKKISKNYSNYLIIQDELQATKPLPHRVNFHHDSLTQLLQTSQQQLANTWWSCASAELVIGAASQQNAGKNVIKGLTEEWCCDDFLETEFHKEQELLRDRGPISRITEVTGIANLYRANLYKANLYRASLYKANLYRANLYRANLYRANLYRRANLYKARLYRASLYKANLYRASLYKANLYRANLYRANLYKANLYRANLYRTSLYKANLYRANLYRANLYRATYMPLHFIKSTV
uniref:Pentapeptide repeat-containing protein n=1 Tax=Poecilia mexicana TaxID=48701 RepID=A0A3B3WJJ1_9TELE